MARLKPRPFKTAPLQNSNFLSFKTGLFGKLWRSGCPSSKQYRPSDVEVEAQGGIADDLVEVAHGEVVVADVSDGGPG